MLKKKEPNLKESRRLAAVQKSLWSLCWQTVRLFVKHVGLAYSLALITIDIMSRTKANPMKRTVAKKVIDHIQT